MSRLPQLSEADAPEASKPLLDAVKAKFGMIPNLVRVFANSPAVLEGYLGLAGALGKGRFDAKQREAYALVTAGTNGCDYCASAHAAAAGSMKVDADEIEKNLDAQSDDAKLAAGLAFAREVIETRGFVSAEALDAVRAAGHSNEEIVEIVGNVTLNILTNYTNHVADTDIDFPARTAKSKVAA